MTPEERLRALEPVIRRNASKVVRLNAELRQDAIQEGRIRVWQALESGEQVSEGLAGFLSRQAALDLLCQNKMTGDSRGSRRRYEPDAALSLTPKMDAIAANTPGRPKDLPAMTSPDHADEVDLRLTVGEAVDALPDRERALVRMVYFDDLPKRDAAARLGLAPETVSRLLSRRVFPALRETLGDLAA